jgi:hypothetical protein
MAVATSTKLPTIRLADCRDRARLAAVYARLRALHAHVRKTQAELSSVHAHEELEILAGELATHAEGLEICAVECADQERDDAENVAMITAQCRHDDNRGILP